MSMSYTIPEEVIEFFSDNMGKTLLIKGTPGSGKTAFALTLLVAMKGNGIYLSTRVDPETLYQQAPWIKEGLSPDNIVDATLSERPTKTLQIRPLKYTNVPEFLKAVYTRTERIQNPIVVIDSWDAVASYTGYYDLEERQKLEHNICDFARKTNIRIIFIVEYTEQRPLDYLVDGVISVTNETVDNRLIRKMIIQKLRGYPIKQPVYIFTLLNGVFKSFQPYKKQEVLNPIKPEPIPDISDDRISTGIRQLDEIIGGYGRFNLFEGDHLPFEILIQSLIINSANLNRTVVFISERYKQPDFITEVLPFIRDENKVILVNGMDELREKKDMLGGEKLKPIAIIYLDDFYEERDEFNEVLRDVCKNCIVFGYTRENGDVRREMEPIASTYIKTKVIFGVPCIYGISPWTSIYAMTVDTGEGYPKIALTQII